MYRTLLIPLDGSPEAERPIATAAAMVNASAEPGRLILLRSAAGEGEGAGPAHVRAMEEAEAYLRSAARPLVESGYEVSAVTSYGPLADSVLAQLTNQDVDLIAMATHGRWGMDRLVHGSLAEEIAHRARVPLLLFGPETKPTDRVRRLLVPLDGGPFTAAVLPEAGRATRSFGIEQVDLLAILPPQTVHVDDLEGAPPAWALEKLGLKAIGNSAYALDARQPAVQERLAELEHALKYWSDWLNETSATVNVHVRYELGVGSTAGCILTTARELGADLIAMRTHARRGLSRALTGSVADEVVRTSPLPVLLYTTETLEALASASPATTFQIEINT